MDPQRASVLVGPVSALETFEAMDEKRSPGLVHRKAHSLIIGLSIEHLVRLKDLLLTVILANHSILNCLPEFLEWVLSLQSLTETGLLERHLLSRGFSFGLDLLLASLLIQLVIQALTLLVSQVGRSHTDILRPLDHILLRHFVIQVSKSILYLKRLELRGISSSCRIQGFPNLVLLHEFVDLLILKAKLSVITVYLCQLGLSLLNINGEDVHPLSLNLLGLLPFEHLVSVFPLILVQPRVVGQLVPIRPLIEDSESPRSVHVKVNQLVSMLESRLVGGILDLILQILARLVVNPGTAEEARADTLLLTDDLATADAVVDKVMLRALAVADHAASLEVL